MIWALIEMVVHTKNIHLATQQHWKAVRKSSSSRKRTFGKYNKQSKFRWKPENIRWKQKKKDDELQDHGRWIQNK